MRAGKMPALVFCEKRGILNNFELFLGIFWVKTAFI